MRIRNLKVPNSRLVEGSYHTFEILKIIEPEPGNPQFVLKDPLGYKVLMHAIFYKNYGFSNGNKIVCRVDRVNCNGLMFLEPMHPIYKEGEVYFFEIIGKKTVTGFSGKSGFAFVVADALGNQWDIMVKPSFLDSFTIGDVIRCYLERIKKGKFFLRPVLPDNLAGGLTIGEYQHFVIQGEYFEKSNKNHYWVLLGQDGEHYPVNKKYYTHYGLKTGQNILCRATGFTLDGYYFLEPENPWYQIGLEYEFKALEINRLEYLNGTQEYVLVLDDPFNEPFKMFIDQEDVERVRNQKMVRCLLQNIKKSRLETKLISL